MKKITAILLIAIFLSGCAGPTMQLKHTENANVRPMGLFVCTSSQMGDDKDLIHRKFIIDVSTAQLSAMLKDKYDLKPLNDKISHDEVFKKHFGSFSIDEKKIAQIARQEGCGSVLIVYYAVADMNVFFMTSPGLFILLRDTPQKSTNDLTLHARCSLYGWLVNTPDASVLAKSHSILSPFSEYIQDNKNKEQLYSDYVAYIKGITKEMFLSMITNN